MPMVCVECEDRMRMVRRRVKSSDTPRLRRWWLIAGVVLVVWTLGAWFVAASSHSAYERCEAHPGPGIVICTDGAPLVWVAWAIPVIVSAIVVLVVVTRRTLASVDAQIDNAAGSDDHPTEKPG